MQTVLEPDGVEFHRQSERAAARSEVGERLGLMYREEAVDRLEFEKDGLIDDDVGSVTFADADVVVDDRRGDLERQAVVVELPTEALAIDGSSGSETSFPCILMARPIVRSVGCGLASGERTFIAGVERGPDRFAPPLAERPKK